MKQPSLRLNVARHSLVPLLPTHSTIAVRRRRTTPGAVLAGRGRAVVHALLRRLVLAVVELVLEVEGVDVAFMMISMRLR